MTTRWNKDGVRRVGGFRLEVFRGFNTEKPMWVVNVLLANTIINRGFGVDERAARLEAERLVRAELDRALDDLGDDGREETGGGK